jgi:hypothetical protein
MKCHKKYMPKPPVSKFLVCRCDLHDGRSFTFVTDLPENEFITISESYLSISKEPSEMGVIMACKFLHPKCICVTEEQFNESGANKYIGNATKEDYDRENN